jgi:hypothetical protein
VQALEEACAEPRSRATISLCLKLIIACFRHASAFKRGYVAKLQEGTEESNDYKDVSPLVDRRDAPADLCKAARIIDDVVRRLGTRMDADLAPRDRNGGWSASYALANHYADGQEAVGAHAGDCLLAANFHTTCMTS